MSDSPGIRPTSTPFGGSKEHEHWRGDLRLHVNPKHVSGCPPRSFTPCHRWALDQISSLVNFSFEIADLLFLVTGLQRRDSLCIALGRNIRRKLIEDTAWVPLGTVLTEIQSFLSTATRSSNLFRLILLYADELECGLHDATLLLG